jgi:hypothetical protein
MDFYFVTFFGLGSSSQAILVIAAAFSFRPSGLDWHAEAESSHHERRCLLSSVLAMFVADLFKSRN